MNDLTWLISKISGSAKATLVVSEFKLKSLSLPELAELLHYMVASDLERIGLLEMIRQESFKQGLSAETIDQLIRGLNGEPASDLPPAPSFPEPAPRKTICVRPIERSQTVNLNQPPPPPLLPGQGHRLPRQTHFLKKVGAVPEVTTAPTNSTQTVSMQKNTHEATFFGEIGGSAPLNLLAQEKLGKTQILIADDDPRIRMVFKMRLEAAGFSTMEAPTGDVAWSMIKSDRPAAMIMDMKMPGLHGLEILAKLTSESSSLPVCVCSAYDQLKEEFVIRNYPRLRYFVKPVKADELVSALKEMLSGVK